jgi:hypothetical protein
MLKDETLSLHGLRLFFSFSSTLPLFVLSTAVLNWIFVLLIYNRFALPRSINRTTDRAAASKWTISVVDDHNGIREPKTVLEHC